MAIPLSTCRPPSTASTRSSDAEVQATRTFRDPSGSNRVGMIVEIPDFAVFERLMQSEGAA